MRNAVINRKFNLFWVNHQKLDFVGRRVIKNADNHRIQANRFTGTGRTGDKQMGHFGKVRVSAVAGNVFAERDKQLGFCGSVLFSIDNFPKRYGCAVAVRDFYADRGFVRNRRFNTDSAGGKVQRNIVRKVCNTADFHAGRGLNFITRNRRAAANIHNPGFHAETFQRVDQFRRVGFQFIFIF